MSVAHSGGQWGADLSNLGDEFQVVPEKSETFIAKLDGRRIRSEPWDRILRFRVDSRSAMLHPFSLIKEPSEVAL